MVLEGHVSETLKHVLTASEVQRFLGKSKRSFYLLRHRTDESFPAPFVMLGRDHWLTQDVVDWIASRRRSDAVPGRRALVTRRKPNRPRAA